MEVKGQGLDGETRRKGSTKLSTHRKYMETYRDHECQKQTLPEWYINKMEK